MKEIMERRAQIVDRMESLHSGAVAEGRDLTADESAEWGKLDGEFASLTAQVERQRTIDERRASAGTVVGAGGGMPAVLKIGRGDTEQRAVAHYLRTGDASGLAESRAYNATDMNIGTPADGGYAVPTGMYNGIIAKRDETMIAPRVGVVPIPGTGLTVNVPIDNEADVLFTSVAEAAALGQDAPALGQKAMTLVKYGKHVDFSWELLRDEDANLVAFVENWIGRGIAATENSLLVTEALAGGTAGLTLDSATAIGIAEIPEFVGKLAPEYQDGAQWLLNSTTVAYLQGLTSATPFIFAPAAQGYAGRPSLWGFPVNQTSFMPAIASVQKSMVLGNFAFMGRRQGTSITMLRDPYTAAGTGQIKLWFWFDAVYGVLQAEAIQYATQLA